MVNLIAKGTEGFLERKIELMKRLKLNCSLSLSLQNKPYLKNSCEKDKKKPP